MDVMRQSQLASILGTDGGNGSASSGVGASLKSSSRSEDLDGRMEEEVTIWLSENIALLYEA